MICCHLPRSLDLKQKMPNLEELWNGSILKNRTVCKVTIFPSPEKKNGGKSKEEKVSAGEREGEEREEKKKEQNGGERKEEVAGEKEKQEEKGGERKEIALGERREEVSGEKMEKKIQGERKEEIIEDKRAWARSKAMYRARSMGRAMWMQKKKGEDKCLDSGLHASDIKPNEGDTAVCAEGMVCDIVTQQKGYNSEVEAVEPLLHQWISTTKPPVPMYWETSSLLLSRQTYISNWSQVFLLCS